MRHHVNITFPFDERGHHALASDYVALGHAVRPLITALEDLEEDPDAEGCLVDIGGAFSYFELRPADAHMALRDLVRTAVDLIRNEVANAEEDGCKVVVATVPQLTVTTQDKPHGKVACGIAPDIFYPPEIVSATVPDDTVVELFIQLYVCPSKDEGVEIDEA